jgi:hypothetical protein
MNNLDLTTLAAGTMVTSDFYKAHNTSFKFIKASKSKVSLKDDSISITSTGRHMSVYLVPTKRFLKDFYLA